MKVKKKKRQRQRQRKRQNANREVGSNFLKILGCLGKREKKTTRLLSNRPNRISERSFFLKPLKNLLMQIQLNPLNGLKNRLGPKW